MVSFPFFYNRQPPGSLNTWVCCNRPLPSPAATVFFRFCSTQVKSSSIDYAGRLEAKGEFTGKLGCSSICAALNQTIWKVSNGREHCCETVWLATFTEMFTEINHALPGFKVVISLDCWSHILLQCHFHFSSDVPPFSAQGPFTVQLWHFHFPFRVPLHSAQVT